MCPPNSSFYIVVPKFISPLRLDSLLGLLSRRLQILLQLLALLLRLTLSTGQAASPQHNPGNLGGAGEEEEEVDGSEEDVLGTDDEAPAGPDETGGHESGIGVEGELRSGAGKV